MTRMSLFLFSLWWLPVSAQTAYSCNPILAHAPPDVSGQAYQDARMQLLRDAWLPKQNQPGLFPEIEQCELHRYEYECRFGFRKILTNYELVVTAKGLSKRTLTVSGHYFRCSRSHSENKQMHILTPPATSH